MNKRQKKKQFKKKYGSEAYQYVEKRSEEILRAFGIALGEKYFEEMMNK